MSEIPPPTVPPATPPPPGGGSYTPPPPPPPGSGPGMSPSSDRTLMIVLSYLGLLALIPYLTKKDDPEIHWHAKNGVGLLIAEVIVFVGLSIISWVLPNNAIGAVAGCISAVIGCVLPLAILGLHVYCIIQAVGGKRPRIPVITDFAEKSL